MAEHITVQAAEPYTNRVLLHEANPLHPDGDAFIVSRDQKVQVAKTPAVKRLIRDEAVVVITADASEDAADDEESTNGSGDTTSVENGQEGPVELTREGLDEIHRPELNVLAEAYGVDEPSKLQNKSQVIDAILAKVAEGDD